MELFDDTGQARDAALLSAAVDIPESVDVAMRRRAAEYQGPPTPIDRDGRAWWHRVALLAAHH